MNQGRYIPDEIPGDFWRIIDSAGCNSERLTQLLESMDEEDLLRFCWNYEEAVGQIATLYHELTDFSEDTSEDICRWVVAQGEVAFTRVWDNAEDLISSEATPYGRVQADPGLFDSALHCFEARFGKHVPQKTHDRFV
jgi:hypothetical protein